MEATVREWDMPVKDTSVQDRERKLRRIASLVREESDISVVDRCGISPERSFRIPERESHTGQWVGQGRTKRRGQECEEDGQGSHEKTLCVV